MLHMLSLFQLNHQLEAIVHAFRKKRLQYIPAGSALGDQFAKLSPEDQQVLSCAFFRLAYVSFTRGCRCVRSLNLWRWTSRSSGYRWPPPTPVPPTSFL